MWDSFLLSNFPGLNWGEEKGGAEEISLCSLRSAIFISQTEHHSPEVWSWFTVRAFNSPFVSHPIADLIFELGCH